MKDYPKAMAAGWQPYLDGKTDFASAMHAVIDALPPPAEKGDATATGTAN
jgi:hypothetical protein